MKAKLSSRGTSAMLMTRPHACNFWLSETEMISFWMSNMIRTATASRVREAVTAMLVTVVTVVVVTVDIILASKYKRTRKPILKYITWKLQITLRSSCLRAYTLSNSLQWLFERAIRYSPPFASWIDYPGNDLSCAYSACIQHTTGWFSPERFIGSARTRLTLTTILLRTILL